MNKTLGAVLLFVASCSLALFIPMFLLAQNPSYTPNFGFELPAYGTTNWQVPLNYNFNLLDRVLAGNSSVSISTWSPTVTYNVGNLVVYNGLGYISLADANTNNLPTNATWWTDSLGTTSANTTSSALNPGCLPVANGANSIVASLFCDNGTTGTYTGTGGFSIASGAPFIIGPDLGLWRTAAGYLSIGSATSSSTDGTTLGVGGIYTGYSVVSGMITTDNIQNGTPNGPVTFSEGGSGATTVVVNGGLNINGAIYATGSWGTPGYVLSSNGPGTPVSWIANGSGGGTTNTICSGTLSLGTALIASGAAATVVTATCSTLATTDNIQLDFNADPTSTTGYSPSVGGMLTIIKYPTANTINVKVVNNTAASITPGAVTMNYRVVR
jgi:hypothetical protein